MTWHALRIFVIQALLLGIGSFAFYLFFTWPHRGRHWLHRATIGTAEHPRLRGWFGRHPAIGKFLRRYFDRDDRSWVRLAIGGLVLVVSAWFFLHIMVGVLSDSKVVQMDLRLHNTLRLFRSEELHRRYSAITRLASVEFVLPFVLTLGIVLFLCGLRREAAFLFVIWAAEVIFTGALKYLVHRPRPPDAQGLHLGPSFPSGHSLTAAAVYGFCAYLLLRDEEKSWWRIIAGVALVVYIALVPLSRVYLGVHWPYDTIASIGLGAALLAIFITIFKYPPWETRLKNREPLPRARAIAIAYGIAAAVYAAWFATARLEPEVRPADPPIESAVAAQSLTSFPSGLGKTSEDLAAGPMEPVAFLFVGSASQVEQTFERAGWARADLPSVRGLLHELSCVIRDAPDPQGPATPAYHEAQPQDLTFERPGTASGSIRHRHHIRIWRTTVLDIASRQPLWAATCSYDMGVEIVPKPYLVTHRIDPDVDREREMIASQLRGAGARDLAFIAVTGPTHGNNAGGDNFFTDGKAHVIAMP